jgi:hypothetical protein
MKSITAWRMKLAVSQNITVGMILSKVDFFDQKKK